MSIRIRTIAPLLLISILLAFICGCEKAMSSSAKEGATLSKTPANAKSEIPVAGASLFDGFEGPEHTVWAFDSADDEGIAEYVSEGATQGKKALKITLRDRGRKGKLHLRRDVEVNLTQASALVVDITSPADNLGAALALKSDPGDVYQEIKPVLLSKGLNKDVRFALDGKEWKNAQSKWEYSGPPVNLQGVKRLMLLLFNGETGEGSFVVDNLRIEGAEGGSTYREWRPEIVLVNYPPEAVSQYDGIEIPVAFRASYRDIFDPNDVMLGMRVTAPTGKNIDVRGFFGGLTRYNGPLSKDPDAAAPAPFWGPMRRPKKKQSADGAANKDEAKPAEEKPKAEDAPKKKPMQSLPVWLLRFTPHETGRYTYQIYVRNHAGEARTQERAFVVAPQNAEELEAGRKGGNVRVSRRDSRQLELQDGSPFYVFGQNVCWTQNWTPYLDKIKAYGGNTCRVWLCPWGLNLERKEEPGTINLQEAERIDRLMKDAEDTGVRIIFCFTYHGATASDWHDSAYNQANGGPCARPQDFFTDWRAKRQFKRLLSYAVTRWGHSPALLSWELINEMNLAKFDNAEDISAWSREMAGHLRTVDVHEHLITTSTTSTGFEANLWNDSRIDFVSVHGYGTNVSQLVYQHLSPFQSTRKPVLLAEFGGGTEAGDDIPDKDGARMQSALWLTACSPGCGMAMPWWWDTYIEARNLYPVFAAAGRFVAGDDRRGRYSEWVKKNLDGGAEVTGVMDSQGARLYVHNPGWTRQPETRGPKLLTATTPLELSGMIDGAYALEFWDAKEGKAFTKSEVTAKEGRLVIELPSRELEFGVKVDRKVRLQPGLK